MATYAEKLKHPNWQRKRLEILQRAKFTCEGCGTDEKTLHVHHAYYEKGLDPWEYPDVSLHVLCDECHRVAQEVLRLLHAEIGKLTLDGIERLYGYAIGVQVLESRTPLVATWTWSYLLAKGLGDAFHESAAEVLRKLRAIGYDVDAAEVEWKAHNPDSEMEAVR